MTKNSWKKVDISVDYGSKGKGAPRGNGGEKGTRRSANDEAGMFKNIILKPQYCENIFSSATIWRRGFSKRR